MEDKTMTPNQHYNKTLIALQVKDITFLPQVYVLHNNRKENEEI